MKYSAARLGRVFIVRLNDGDILHESIESLAEKEGVASAAVIILGGADDGSRLVTGPADGRAEKIEPVESVLKGVHEAAGTGTSLFSSTETGYKTEILRYSCFGKTGVFCTAFMLPFFSSQPMIRVSI